ncbi:MAG: flagellar filament capping protein FliD [Bacteroidetes bacterium]|nr:flagellar filament capping protein FliD [Bacteroidota bacterium]
MAGSTALSTASIDSLVTAYQETQKNRRIVPLETRKDKFSGMSSALGELTTKLSALKSKLYTLKNATVASVFNTRKASSSEEKFVTAKAENGAAIGSYEFFVSQLAKNDLAVSKDLATATPSPLSGTHNFVIKTGDGSTGEFTSNIKVTFDGTETYEEAMIKTQEAINQDKAEVTSDVKVASSAYSGGSSTFTVDINGKETDITVNGGGTYGDLMDEIVAEFNLSIKGVSIGKVLDSPSPGDANLQLYVANSDYYISITPKSGFDVAADLNIAVTKEKGSSGTVTSSVFSPRSGMSQLSITAKESGIDNRIKDLSDSGASTVLTELGLNLGTGRPSFDQNTDPDTPGFAYSDITDATNKLNSKFTFNGLSLQNNSNSVEDLVTGMTFDFKSVMKPGTDNDVNISIDNDVEAITTSIQDFIKVFNETYDFLQTNTTIKDKDRGALVNDPSSRALANTLKNNIYKEVDGLADGVINALTQIGITFDIDKGLTISDDKLLKDKLTYNGSEVKDLFTSTSGIATTFYSEVSGYIGGDGFISKSVESYNTTTTFLGKRIDTVQDSIDKRAELLRSKYQKMQVQLASFLNASSFITGITGGGADF